VTEREFDRVFFSPLYRVEHEALGGRVEERETRLNVFCK
jgi:hypothetical protein